MPDAYPGSAVDSHSDEPREFTLALPARTRLAGGYELLHPLEGGSTASVMYLAHDDRSGAPVLVEEFLPRALAGRREDGHVRPHSPMEEREFTRAMRRFALESELLRDIVHEHLVRVIDVVEENGTAYVVMEPHEGETLATTLASAGGVLPAGRAIETMLCILDALDAVHAEGILHRAISPEAITVSAAGTPRLVGFSAARHVPGAHALASPWMAIEQYGARGLGPWTDVHGCAAVLYRLITGSAPPTATERAAGTPLVAPAVAVPGLAPELSMLMLNALAQSPEQRPHSAGEFRRRLLALGGTKPRPSYAAAGADGSGGSSAPLAGLPMALVPPAAPDGEKGELVVVDSDFGWYALPAERHGRFSLIAPLRRLRTLVTARLARAKPVASARGHRRMLWIVVSAVVTAMLAVGLPLWRGVLRAERTTPAPAVTTTATTRPIATTSAPPVAMSQPPAQPTQSTPSPATSKDTVAMRISPSTTTAGAVISGAATGILTSSQRTFQPIASRSRLPERARSMAAAKSREETRTPGAPPSAGREQASSGTPSVASTAPAIIAPVVHLGPIPVPGGGLELVSAPPALLLALRDRFDAGAKHVDDGDYAAGRRIFHELLVRTDSVLQKYVTSPALTSLRDEIQRADAQARAACGAENDLLRRRGASEKPCA